MRDTLLPLYACTAAAATATALVYGIRSWRHWRFLETQVGLLMFAAAAIWPGLVLMILTMDAGTVPSLLAGYMVRAGLVELALTSGAGFLVWLKYHPPAKDETEDPEEPESRLETPQPGDLAAQAHQDALRDLALRELQRLVQSEGGSRVLAEALNNLGISPGTPGLRLF